MGHGEAYEFAEYRSVVGSNGRVVVTLPERRRHDYEQEANNALIAAAPDLLAALEKIRDTEWIGDCAALMEAFRQRSIIARAAIAKVTGVPE
jgi:hypothetical protein